jgi:hypothetical protein
LHREVGLTEPIEDMGIIFETVEAAESKVVGAKIECVDVQT